MIILLWLIYIFIIWIGAEIFAYLWHRCIAHSDTIPSIHNTHRVHHRDMLEEANADDDFIWLLFLLILFELTIGLLLLVKLITGNLALVTIITVTINFWWNWYIHNAYHIPNHWLNNFSWFRHDKMIHYNHHFIPKCNYGISSHFMDSIFDSLVYID